MDWKKALKMVVGIPDTPKTMSKLGTVPLGEEQTLELPAGEVTICYADSSNPPTSDHRIEFYTPQPLEVKITPAGGGESLEMGDPGQVKVGTAMNRTAWRVIGKVQVPTSGAYVVTGGPVPPDRPEPRLFLS